MSEYLNTLFLNTNTLNLKKPEYIGPGVWWSLHTLAADATTPEKRAFLMNYIEIIKTKFTCDKCRNHFILFCNTNDISMIKTNEGLFKWTYDCHENANIYAGNKRVDYNTVHKSYYTSDFCSMDCGKSKETITILNPQPTIISPNSGIIIKKAKK